MNTQPEACTALEKVLWRTGLPHAVFTSCECIENACGCRDEIDRLDPCYPNAIYDNIIFNEKNANLCASALNKLSEFIHGKPGQYHAVRIKQRTLFADIWKVVSVK